ncbi:MAG: cupin domain-containing protein [Chloroflexi bacterium]|nr:cupin domain-containing protein [Chloroflexota bacterium]
MTYKPSPRPTFDGPAAIPLASTARHLWGDAEAGEVSDWIYVSSDKIHQLLFGLNPGEMFRHSPAHRTIFAADEIYYVVAGAMALANPATGEVQLVRAGEAAFFRRDTWHHALALGGEPLRVLEFFAPPPSQGTSGAYSRTRPYLSESRYVADQLLGRWPMERAAIEAGFSLRLVRDADLLWRIEGHEHRTLIGLLCATEHLTVGRADLRPGTRSDPRQHGGDASLYVLAGVLHVLLPDHDGPRWFELQPGDGFYVPEGVRYQWFNTGTCPASLLFGVAPAYLPRSQP